MSFDVVVSSLLLLGCARILIWPFVKSLLVLLATRTVSYEGEKASFSRGILYLRRRFTGRRYSVIVTRSGTGIDEFKAYYAASGKGCSLSHWFIFLKLCVADERAERVERASKLLEAQYQAAVAQVEELDKYREAS